MKNLSHLQPSRPDRVVHGYVYYRWTERYMALIRWALDRPGLGWPRARAGRWLERTHHAKVVPESDARRIITMNTAIEWRDLERVVPFDTARDIVLEASPTITLAPCACRAVAVVEAAADRGNTHTLWFKDAADGRMYALCNCCTCCCIGMKARAAGFSPLAASGFVAVVSTECCTGCGACVEACPFSAVTLVDGIAVVDGDACLGCGVCVGSCAYSAIELVTGGPAEPLPR